MTITHHLAVLLLAVGCVAQSDVPDHDSLESDEAEAPYLMDVDQPIEEPVDPGSGEGELLGQYAIAPDGTAVLDQATIDFLGAQVAELQAIVAEESGDTQRLAEGCSSRWFYAYYNWNWYVVTVTVCDDGVYVRIRSAVLS